MNLKRSWHADVLNDSRLCDMTEFALCDAIMLELVQNMTKVNIVLFY